MADKKDNKNLDLSAGVVDEPNLSSGVFIGAEPSLTHPKTPEEFKRAAASTGYTAAYGAANLVKQNLPAIGGALGGALGAPGGPAGVVLGSAIGGAGGRAAQQLSEFSEGKVQPSSLEAAKDIGIAGGEQGLIAGIGEGLGWVGRWAKPATKAENLSYALGAGSRAGTDVPKALRTVIPDLDKAVVRAGGQIKNIGQLEQVINTTERGLNTEFGLAIQPIAGQKIVPNQVAAAIRGKITPAMLRDPELAGAVKYLNKRATDFEGEWSISELNDLRETVSKRLRAYYNAARSGAATQVKLDEGIAADQAIESSLKDLLYDAADRSGAKPPGYFRELKQKQSALIDLQDQVEKQKEWLSNVTAARKGAPLREKLHLAGYVHPATGAPGGVMRATPGLFSNPQGTADAAIARAYPGAIGKAVNITRSALGTSISEPNVNALPLRALWGYITAPDEVPANRQEALDRFNSQ